MSRIKNVFIVMEYDMPVGAYTSRSAAENEADKDRPWRSVVTLPLIRKADLEGQEYASDDESVGFMLDEFYSMPTFMNRSFPREDRDSVFQNETLEERFPRLSYEYDPSRFTFDNVESDERWTDEKRSEEMKAADKDDTSEFEVSSDELLRIASRVLEDGREVMLNAFNELKEATRKK